MGEQGSMLETAFEIEVRSIKTDEFEKVFADWILYRLLCVHCSVIRHTLERYQRDFIVALRRGEIIGSCWDVSIRQGRRMIGGVAVNPFYPNVLIRMIYFIRNRYHLDTVLDINIPVSFSSLLDSAGWTRHWDIHLYITTIPELQLLPLENEHRYRFEMIVKDSPIIRRHTPEDIGCQVPMINDLEPTMYVSFNIYEDGIRIGCANLRKAGVWPWIIGPVLAINSEAANHVVRTVFTYLINKIKNGNVFTYILDHHTRYSDFLNNSGFVKARNEWTRYSLNERTYVTSYMTYSFAKDSTFSVECMVCCDL